MVSGPSFFYVRGLWPCVEVQLVVGSMGEVSRLGAEALVKPVGRLHLMQGEATDRGDSASDEQGHHLVENIISDSLALHGGVHGKARQKGLPHE